MSENKPVDRAMAALDTVATVWAAGFDLRGDVQKLMAAPDAESRLIAYIKHAHAEGLYIGRTSHDQSAPK